MKACNTVIPEGARITVLPAVKSPQGGLTVQFCQRPRTGHTIGSFCHDDDVVSTGTRTIPTGPEVNDAFRHRDD